MRSPINNKDLIEYLEANHNLMIFADAEAKKPVRVLVNEFGIEFENAVSGIRGILCDFRVMKSATTVRVN
jgi:hypothetical protein